MAIYVLCTLLRMFKYIFMHCEYLLHNDNISPPLVVLQSQEH